ncbi:MAG: hypothetical protein GX601_03625, partial [Anaerolineales bacterium]|nr:hypothetical protein [Anaerolineales bacterium]
MNQIDTKALKESCDLRHIVEQDLGPAPAHSSRASLWKCPFHGERKGYSLAVWADGFRCFGKCQVSGDVFDWLQRYRGLSFSEALTVLGEAPPAVSPPTAGRSMRAAAPPAPEWQAAAWQVVWQTEEMLWEAPGEWALDYLLNERGLLPGTIRAARLGVLNGNPCQWRTIAGLQVPCGIVIPWLVGETVWGIKVRRFDAKGKYAQ